MSIVPVPEVVALSVSPSSLSRVQRSFQQAGGSSLVVVECVEPDTALLVASHLAPLVVSEAARAADVRVCVPAKDRWTVAELDEMVVGPTRSMPDERHVVVVASADRMDVPAAEHLLKAVEEPDSPTLYVFAVQDGSSLLPTMLGRAGDVVHLDLPTTQERVDSLTRAGVATRDAQDAVALVGSSAAVTGLLATVEGRSEAMEAIRSAFSSPLGVGNSTSRAMEVEAALTVLAERMGQPTGRSKSSESKAMLRSLLRRALASWREATRRELWEADTAATHTRITRHLEALDRAESELSGYASPVNVIAALLARCS